MLYHYVGLPFRNFSLRRDIEPCGGLDLDRINAIIQEHGAPYGIFFQYANDLRDMHRSLSVFTFSENDDEPIDLDNLRITEEQIKAMKTCVTLMLEDGGVIPKIGLYSATYYDWHVLPGRLDCRCK